MQSSLMSVASCILIKIFNLMNNQRLIHIFLTWHWKFRLHKNKEFVFCVIMIFFQIRSYTIQQATDDKFLEVQVLRVNNVLKRVFVPLTEEVTWEWRKLHNEGFIIYTLLITYYADQIEDDMGTREVKRPIYQTFPEQNLTGKHLKRLGIYERTIQRFILKK
jgi:hypothetical protein